MKFVQPEVFLLAKTTLDNSGFRAWLEAMGAPDWDTNAIDGERLIEAAGKSCYKAFKVDLNPNLKRVRDRDNAAYIANILASRHGSVLEHVSVSFACFDVSRVFTHELVRHRIAGFSQESLRFVRLTDLRVWIPPAFREPFLTLIRDKLRARQQFDHRFGDPKGLEITLIKKLREVFEYLEQTQRELADLLCLDDLEGFAEKKILTSAMRRMAPIGLATGIIMTANLRTWRHVIEMRTTAHAEEEIRYVHNGIFRALQNAYPNVFQDAHVSPPLYDGTFEVQFENSKV